MNNSFNFDFLEQQNLSEATPADLRNFAIFIVAAFGTGWVVASGHNRLKAVIQKKRNK